MKTKFQKFTACLLTITMLFTILPTFALLAFAENDNIELTVNIQPLKISKTITISENAEYTELKSKIEEELKVDFDKDGYGIYCPEARIYYHPSSKYYQTDETKTLKALNFKNGYTVNLEKLSWTDTTGNPINVMGLNISGGVGACEPFYSGTSAEVDYDWNYSTKVITIRTTTPITISGTGIENAYIIVNTGSEKANLTIENLTLTHDDGACITLNLDAWLNLEIVGNNSLTATGEKAKYSYQKTPAIVLNNSDSWLNILSSSTGTLTATSNVPGQPGIGTSNDTSTVWGVNINGGTIIATGGEGGAGIRAGEIKITGGNVTANGGIVAYGEGNSLNANPLEITGGTVTANSDAQALSNVPVLENYDGYKAIASTTKDGTAPEVYDSSKNTTYKYFKIMPKVEAPLTVDKPQEYTYDGNAKAFTLPADALDGFSVAYKQGENDITVPTNAGSYDVVITRAEDENYKAYSKTIEKGLVIKAKTIDNEITLTVPVKNEAPQTSIETDEYTATVVWSPEVTDKFAARTEYTATITITPKVNYTVDGIAKDSYTVDGATSVINAANSNIVTAVFPKTAGSSGSAVATYTVKFDTNGGSAVKNQTVTEYQKAKEPTAPTKDGYTFAGWYSDKALTKAYDFTAKVTQNMTLYAKWIADDEKDSDDKKDDSSAEIWNNPFTDVKADDWYYNAVKYVNQNKLMGGMTSSTFAPNEPLTRGMLVTILYRMEGNPTVVGTMPFADVNANAYYYNAILWAVQNNIVSGVSATEFAPDVNITREQIASILQRYAQYKGYDTTQGGMQIREYSDYDKISGYAMNAMTWAVNSGLLKGKGNNTIAPQDLTTRAEIAAILQRFIESNK